MVLLGQLRQQPLCGTQEHRQIWVLERSVRPVVRATRTALLGRLARVGAVIPHMLRLVHLKANYTQGVGGLVHIAVTPVTHCACYDHHKQLARRFAVE